MEEGIQVCSLHAAYKQKSGDTIYSEVSQALLEIDSSYVEIVPNWGLRLFFHQPAAICSSSWKRDFVLVSTGRYGTYEGTGFEEIPKEVKPKFTFSIQPTQFVSLSEINYTLPHISRISLKVYDATGQLTTTLEKEIKQPGRYSILWDGTDDKGERLPAGTYFIKLQAGEYSQTKKLVLLR